MIPPELVVTLTTEQLAIRAVCLGISLLWGLAVAVSIYRHRGGRRRR